MTTPAPPQRWLAGWLDFSPPYERFTGRNADIHSWDESAAWLRHQILEHAPEWGPSEVATMHRRDKPPFDILSFPGHEAFVQEGLPLRRDRGVWASDGQRCFYIIRDHTPPPVHEAADEGTPPLHMSLPPIVPQFVPGEALPVRHIAPPLVPAG
jgi:hypothetical protein